MWLPTPTPDEAERFPLVRKVWDMVLAGETYLRTIHKTLLEMGLTGGTRHGATKPVSYQAVYELLRDRFYVGEIPYKGEYLPGKH
jgi:hypothetical protein